MNRTIRPWKVMATLDELRNGNDCPHESYCACRKGHWCPEAKHETSSNKRDYPMMHLAGCSFAYDRCCCRVLEEIDTLAKEYLKCSGVREPPVSLGLIDLFDPRRKIEIRYVPLKRYLGCTWLVDREWVVHLNETVPYEVRHYTAFHEGFHIICGSPGLAFKHASAGCHAVAELLADYFAASMLMPGEFVGRIWPKVQDCAEMARIFAVPEPIMREWLTRLRMPSTRRPDAAESSESDTWPSAYGCARILSAGQAFCCEA